MRRNILAALYSAFVVALIAHAAEAIPPARPQVIAGGPLVVGVHALGADQAACAGLVSIALDSLDVGSGVARATAFADCPAELSAFQITSVRIFQDGVPISPSTPCGAGESFCTVDAAFEHFPEVGNPITTLSGTMNVTFWKSGEGAWRVNSPLHCDGGILPNATEVHCAVTADLNI